MTVIVYLHGFSSGAASAKAGFLRAALVPLPVVVPDYPAHRPHAAVRTISRCLQMTREQYGARRLTLVGSSLGGYYAQYLGAHLDQVERAVLINPALQPQRTLAAFVGRNSNMVTGEAFEFSQRDFEALADYELAPHLEPAPTLVLLDAGDELIDYRFAAERYSARGRVVVYPGGSHAFEHLQPAVREIRAFVKKEGGEGGAKCQGSSD